MNPRRRAMLLAALAASGPGAGASAAAVRRGRPLAFPRDHGAHLETRTEWWYVTGWLGTPQALRYGFQITFFRSATGLAAALASRFAARQILFAHAAITDLSARRHHHAQRIVRWNGLGRATAGHAAERDTDVAIGARERWFLVRDAGEPSSYRATFTIAGMPPVGLALRAAAAPLLQGDAGYSRKGPEERHASHYVSEPQLEVQATVGRESTGGRAWLDHEWSDELLAEGAVGWDWIGINLFDGSALTAFRLRRADGSVVWAGGSWRERGNGAARAYTPEEVRFVPTRNWRSPASGAVYPVEWRIELPNARYAVRALLDAQELDGNASTGAVYWEGLSELLDSAGQRVGLGYLEMTGYAAPIKLG